MAKIDIDQLEKEIVANLRLYADATTEIVEKAVKETAKETRNVLRVTSPVATGDYAESWEYKRDTTTEGRKNNMIVYSEKPDYRLTHLLEYGHAKRNGGRTKAFPHIKYAEESAEKRLIYKITNGIKELSE